MTTYPYYLSVPMCERPHELIPEAVQHSLVQQLASPASTLPRCACNAVLAGQAAIQAPVKRPVPDGRTMPHHPRLSFLSPPEQQRSSARHKYDMGRARPSRCAALRPICLAQHRDWLGGPIETATIPQCGSQHGSQNSSPQNDRDSHIWCALDVYIEKSFRNAIPSLRRIRLRTP